MPADSRPNILFITADDMNWDAVGAFAGSGKAVTPTLDRLAAEGAIFRHAHVSMAICQPSRQAMMTGRYPHNSRAPGFHPIADDVPTLQEQLRAAGYLNAIAGKYTHLAPSRKFCWDRHWDLADLGMGRDPRRYATCVAEVLDQAHAERRPFFLMCNSHDPHRPFHGSQQEREHPHFGFRSDEGTTFTRGAEFRRVPSHDWNDQGPAKQLSANQTDPSHVALRGASVSERPADRGVVFGENGPKGRRKRWRSQRTPTEDASRAKRGDPGIQRGSAPLKARSNPGYIRYITSASSLHIQAEI